MGPMHAKSKEALTSSRWCGVKVRRRVSQLRCRSRHLAMVQNYEVRRQYSFAHSAKIEYTKLVEAEIPNVGVICKFKK
ncbi:hypothetical protein TNCV_4459701 [Trichonephila clavipes]|nr:hypothetical protein TNCV_4459701 [Trichonephila clavipes]